MNSKWQYAAEQSLKFRLEDLVQIGGGDFATAYRASSGSQSLFIKTHADPPAGFFGTEATGLRWLHETRTVNIPQVLAFADSPPYLALQWINVGVPHKHTERQLGEQLAALHMCPQKCFGRADSATTGSLAVPNDSTEHWQEFYSTRRLLPLLEIAAQRKSLPVADLTALESIATNLSSLGVPEEPPSLLHGDLWAGNRLIDDKGVSWLIDPAAHCGHREFELGMMALFGGFGDDCFAAYHACYPLQPQWQERLPLHQLAPLVVHAIKFGGSYQSAVRAALRKFT